LTRQAKKLSLTSRAFRNDQLPLLYRQLSEMTGYEMSLPMNSGAEAVETALKLARKWAYLVKGVKRHKAEIIVAGNNFHGRTISIVSFSSDAHYREDFGPFTPGFVSVPYGDAKAVDKAVNKDTAAVMIEPIQGEAGVIIPPAGYLAEVKKVCEKHGILFIADEIQTGLGRTGKLFACQHENVRADMTIIGKALGGGFYPVSAVLADAALLGLFTPGEHGSTFGGNPLAAAVASAALTVHRGGKTGRGVRPRWVSTSSTPLRKDRRTRMSRKCRGKGLLIGVELKPEAGGARRFCEAPDENWASWAKETPR
jgi:ornithine--oxo-acid transaminase